MTLIQKKHDPKVIEKNFVNKKDAHILSKCNKEKIIKIHHWSPEIFKFLCTQKMMVFCNFLEIKAETKKVVGVKVVPFGVVYSSVKFRRLKMGYPVYMGSCLSCHFFAFLQVSMSPEPK